MKVILEIEMMIAVMKLEEVEHQLTVVFQNNHLLQISRFLIQRFLNVVMILSFRIAIKKIPI